MGRRVKVAAAKAEKKQQRIDAGLLSELYPKVSKITINMLYSQTGALEPLSRIVNYFPGSTAIFKVNCLCSECTEGFFDFTKILGTMVKARKTTLKGLISCETCSAPECSDVAYTIHINYAPAK